MSGPLPVDLARVHMVGVGGAGMSGLARILLARGGKVSGTDVKEGRSTVDLATRGAAIQIGHSPDALDLLPGGPTVVVTTHAAIPKDNPELVAARERGIPILLRPEVLARLMTGYRTVLVAGTHGKTSTTSMTVVAAQEAGLDPSFAVGGEINESGTNAHHGSGAVFIAEADESDGSLLQYRPDIAVVTNVDADHLDFFGSVEKYVQVFDDFVELIAPGGSLIVCLDDPGSAALAQRHVSVLRGRDVAVLGYGSGPSALAPDVECVVRLEDWRPTPTGSAATLVVTEADKTWQRDLTLLVPGEHMAGNAVAALMAAVAAGASPAAALTAVAGFTGVNRRFTLRGRTRGISVYDDYAHHPTEIAAVLTAARGIVASQGVNGRIIALFQPHLYSRTERFAAEFAEALSLADIAIVAEVYPAREEPIPGVSGRLIASRIPGAIFSGDLSSLAAQVAAVAQPGDLVITLGAGDITMQGEPILAALG